MVANGQFSSGAGARRRLAPMLGDLAAKKICAASQLVDSFDAVFDADPVVVESDPL